MKNFVYSSIGMEKKNMYLEYKLLMYFGRHSLVLFVLYVYFLSLGYAEILTITRCIMYMG